MLKISNVETFYGKIQALRGVDIDVNDGEIVSLIGSNGAGKSTLLMTISGVNKARNGNITFNGERIENRDPHKIVDLGICQVPEGRRIFSRLTVEDNLRLGASVNEKGKNFDQDSKDVYDLFPVQHSLVLNPHQTKSIDQIKHFPLMQILKCPSPFLWLLELLLMKQVSHPFLPSK